MESSILATFCLIARIGQNAPFAVGAYYRSTVAASGTLSFIANDSWGDFLDNTGSMSVQINVY